MNFNSDKKSFDVKGFFKEDDSKSEGRTNIGWRFWTFAVIFNLFNLFQGMQGTFMTPTLTTLEKQFGLPSTKSGFLVSAGSIGYLIVVMFISYLGSKWHKPLLFAISAFTTAFAAFLAILPYIIYGFPGDTNDVVTYNAGNVTYNNTAQSKPMVMNLMMASSPLCNDGGASMSGDSGTCGQTVAGENEFNPVAYGIILAGVICYGISMSPVFTLGIAFYTDILGVRRASAFTGILFFVRYISPVICYVIAGKLLTIFITLQDTGLTPYHPAWLGAWWLGYVIFGSGCLFCGIVLLFCPPYLGTKKRVTDEDQDDKKELVKKPGFFKQMKGVNPVMYLLIAGGCMNALTMGYLSFVPKYLEKQFHQPISTASILAGMGMVLAGALANLLSGVVAMRVKWSLARITKLAVGITIFMAACFSILMAVKCPQKTLAGIHGATDSSFNLTTSCNSGCFCEPVYNPVCGSDGNVYFSACHAGCKHTNGTGMNQVHTDCSCIPDGVATPGVCQSDCPMVYVYVSIQFVAWFIINIFTVPILNGMLGCARQELVGMVMAIYTFLAMVMYFPSPIFFGALIDSACLISHETCGVKGACLWYNIDEFRYKLHLGPVIICLCVGLPFYTAALILAHFQAYKKKKTERERLNST